MGGTFLRGVSGHLGVQGQLRLPLTVGDPAAILLLGERHREQTRRLTIIFGLVHGFGLQRQRLRICLVKTGVVIVAVDKERDRHQTHSSLGEELNHGNGASISRTLFLGGGLVRGLLILPVPHLGPVLSIPKSESQQDRQHRADGCAAQNAV